MSWKKRIIAAYRIFAIYFFVIGLAFTIGGLVLNEMENFKVSSHYLLISIVSYLMPHISGIENKEG